MYAIIKHPVVATGSTIIFTLDQKQEQAMKIGEIAQKSQCNIETIRFYEKEKLLTAPGREANGYRQYTKNHLVQLKFIRHCRSLNMGLADVRLLLDLKANPDLACEEINDLIDKQITEVHQQVESLHLLEEQLHALRATCQTSHKTVDCGILQNLEKAAKGEDD